MTSPAPPQRLAYSDLLNRVNAGHVVSVSIDNLGGVDGRLDRGRQFTSQIPTALTSGTSELEHALLGHNVKITGKQAGSSPLLNVVLSFLPLLLIIGLFVWSGRAARRSLTSGIGGIGRSRAKITDAQRPTTRFKDIAGYDGAKQEITEVVDFLRTPDRYAKAGAVGPRGVLMVGPPGTGKTLLARAVAGEADVPFLSITGSGFVELFVGVGASRVRDLFADARKRSPAIIFIDEIDAIGGRRGGSGGFATNDEREQTLAPAGGALTPTEQRVAELVAEGRRNKEVAATLFVTVKAVEANLSRVYAKLGIRSRAELVRRLAGEPEPKP